MGLWGDLKGVPPNFIESSSPVVKYIDPEYLQEGSAWRRLCDLNILANHAFRVII